MDEIRSKLSIVTDARYIRPNRGKNVVIEMEEHDQRHLETKIHNYIASIQPNPLYYYIKNSKTAAEKTYIGKSYEMTLKPVLMPLSGSKTNVALLKNNRVKTPQKQADPVIVAVKPRETLPQLVAEVILDSPEKILKTCHIYIILKRRYPFFQRHSTSEKSWKSSVRHALTLETFQKLKLITPKKTNTRNYWAVNCKEQLKTSDSSCDFCIDTSNSVSLNSPKAKFTIFNTPKNTTIASPKQTPEKVMDNSPPRSFGSNITNKTTKFGRSPNSALKNKLSDPFLTTEHVKKKCCRKLCLSEDETPDEEDHLCSNTENLLGSENFVVLNIPFNAEGFEPLDIDTFLI